MTPKEVTAIVVTRGDVDLSEILESLRQAEFGEIIIANNAERVAAGLPDLGPYAQFEAAGRAKFGWLYFQDDDVVVDNPAAIVAAARERVIVCNMGQEYREQYKDAPDRLMGFGSCFEKMRVEFTFSRYQDFGFPINDPVTLREPGRLFTGLNECELVDVPLRHLPWASAPNRLWKQPDHRAMRDKMRQRVKTIKAASQWFSEYGPQKHEFKSLRYPRK